MREARFMTPHMFVHRSYRFHPDFVFLVSQVCAFSVGFPPETSLWHVWCRLWCCAVCLAKFPV